jgi:hypothetical protein
MRDFSIMDIFHINGYAYSRTEQKVLEKRRNLLKRLDRSQISITSRNSEYGSNLFEGVFLGEQTKETAESLACFCDSGCYCPFGATVKFSDDNTFVCKVYID